MALRFVDGFDHYDKAHFDQKWTQHYFSGAGAVNGIQAGGRSGNCVQFSHNVGAGTDWIGKSLDSQTTWTVGFAFKTGNFSINGQVAPINIFLDGSLGQIMFGFDVSGFLCAYTIDGSTVFNNGTYPTYHLMAKSSQALVANTWAYLECQTTFSATAGQMTARINGVTAINTAANLNTAPSGNASANAIYLMRSTNNITVYDADTQIDDLYACDGTGNANNGFLGDVRIAPQYPSGPGSSSQFSVVGSSANWSALNDNPPNDDTSYVASGTAGQQDLYTFTAPPALAGTVFGLQINLFARKDDAGVRTIAPLVRTGSTTAAGGQVNPGTSYQDLTTILETNPANGNAAFTYAELSTDQFGVQEVV